MRPGKCKLAGCWANVWLHCQDVLVFMTPCDMVQARITSLPSDVLSTPMGQMLAPMLTGKVYCHPELASAGRHDQRDACHLPSPLVSNMMAVVLGHNAERIERDWSIHSIPYLCRGGIPVRQCAAGGQPTPAAIPTARSNTAPLPARSISSSYTARKHRRQC